MSDSFNDHGTIDKGISCHILNPSQRNRTRIGRQRSCDGFSARGSLGGLAESDVILTSQNLNVTTTAGNGGCVIFARQESVVFPRRLGVRPKWVLAMHSGWLEGRSQPQNRRFAGTPPNPRPPKNSSSSDRRSAQALADFVDGGRVEDLVVAFEETLQRPLCGSSSCCPQRRCMP